MRHRKAGRKLGRDSSHRKAMLRNMVTSLFRYEQIETTDAKARQLRPVAEKMITDHISPLCQACGFKVADYNEAKQYPRRIALETLPLADDVAKQEAKSVLDETNPSLIITIEKAAPNEKGVYHSGVGYDVSALEGKVSYLIEEAKNRGIFTIGIGDGGNEVGMGCIKETVKRVLRTGADCGCPCDAGTHSDIATDL